MKTTSKILNRDFDFKVNHIGLFVNDDLWVHDKYIVIIEGQDFEYSSGIGHRIELNHFTKDDFKKIKSKNPKQTKENLLVYADELKKVSKVKPLNIDDVLYSLVLDSDFACETFDDFCDNLGYDNDSMKANEIYKACQKNAKKVKSFISDLEKARELFQDY
jgi:hypothetical protein